MCTEGSKKALLGARMSKHDKLAIVPQWSKEIEHLPIAIIWNVYVDQIGS